MRIISKFRDFYDGGAAYGVDMTTVYTRETEEVKPVPQYLRKLIEQFPDRSYLKDEAWYYANVLLFCGKTYLFYRKYTHPRMGYQTHTPENNEYFWDIEKYAAEWEERRAAQTQPKWMRRPDNYRNSAYSWNDRLNWSPAGLRESVKVASQFDCTEILQRYKVPIIRLEKKHDYTGALVFLNPCLKDIGFQKVMDPFQVFQQIDMFVSGVLPQEGHEMVEVSDKVRAEKHGMDKWSFRKKVR